MIRWFPVGVFACVAASCITPPPIELPDTSALTVGESRTVELYAIRLDVTNYEQTLTKADIQALPASVRDDMWLLDLDIAGGSGSPLLMDNALEAIADLDPSDPALSQAERNMIRVVQMTPDTADLEGTGLQELLDLSPKVGISPPEVLAESMGVGVEEPFLTSWALTDALVDGLIGTHPKVRTRKGSATPEHPDGRIPVPRGHIPITLGDCASDMATMPVRFGAYVPDADDPEPYHPGFIVQTSGAKVLTDDFTMTIRASANALPYKGIDLTRAEVGNVNAIGHDTSRLFDFSDPDWLRFEGLEPEPVISSFTFGIVEYPTFVAGGTNPLPTPYGDSPVWTTPTWCVERLIADAAIRAFGDWSFSGAYALGGQPDPLFTIDIDQGWMTMVTLGDVGSPPAPMYLWDLMTEVGQKRLHDGPDPFGRIAGSVPEGAANLAFTLYDLPLGITTERIRDAIRQNLELDPTGLIEAASVVLDQSWGTPDFFYYRPRASAAADVQGDWLYFIAASDIPEDAERSAEAYANPGFFVDEALTEQASTLRNVEGDSVHEKVAVVAGDVLYVEDDDGAVFRIDVGEKPSSHRIVLTLTRIR